MTRRRLKARDRRGGVRKAQAKRRARLAGRAPDPDFGTAELRAIGWRRRPRPTCRPISSVLYGRGVIDLEQYGAGVAFAAMVRLVHLGYGLTGASPPRCGATSERHAGRPRALIDWPIPAPSGPPAAVALPPAAGLGRLARGARRGRGRAAEAAVVDGLWTICAQRLTALVEMLPRQRAAASIPLDTRCRLPRLLRG